MRKTVLYGLLGAAAIMLAGCASAGEAQSLTLGAEDLAFSPTTLTVAAGQPVALTLQNNGALEHDFSILEIPIEGPAHTSGSSGHTAGHSDAAEPDLHVSAVGGQSATVEFIPSKPGSYEFWCTVPGHKEAGMTGTLEVTGPQ